MPNLFDVAVCTIFAREFMEGAIIIGEFRTVIQKSEVPADENAPSKESLMRAVNIWAAIAAAVAVLVVLIVAIPLAVMSRELNDKTVELIEGISKLVAAICILQFSLKIPKWLGFYKSMKAGKVSETFDLTMNAVRFNVAWNIWREVAECGVFLLPFFLNKEGLGAIPLSALIGIVVGLSVGFFVYWANRQMKQKIYVAIFVTLVLVFLSAGLFVGGCHEFEEVFGETKDVWKIHGNFWNHKKLPMAIFKPFGYSSSRTVLQITSFWCFLALAAGLHGWKMMQTKKINESIEANQAEAKLGGLGKTNSPEASDEDERV
jgi:high-affinity iron transporter